VNALPRVVLTSLILVAVVTSSGCMRPWGDKTRPVDVRGTADSTPIGGNECHGSANVLGPSPVGRTLASGDVLKVGLEWTAPRCSRVEITFHGYHVAGSPWYRYWCVDHPGLVECTPERTVRSTLYSLLTPITSSDSGTFRAEAGNMPPASPDSRPPFEGFTPCVVVATFSQGVFGTGSFQYVLGKPCPP
jgi:hypothetical protein